ncbi:hypothetical protein Hanom_Chr02g00112361 [Helianthus anomalus]
MGINNYNNIIEELKKELAIAKCEHGAIKLKLESYSNSRYVLDHIIEVQKLKGDVKCIGYKPCPPPLRHNYIKLPDEEECHGLNHLYLLIAKNLQQVYGSN